jgi:transposase
MLPVRRSERLEVGDRLVPRARQQFDPGCPEAPPTVAPGPAGQHADQILVEVGAPLGRDRRKEATVEVIYPRCCGLDVHKQSVTACLLVPGDGARPRKEVRTFGTVTDEVLRLGDWLAAHGVTHVAMESTGVYWKPLWNLLEDRFELLLVNAAHVKAVPGRKTDVRDSEWLAELLRHGLLRPSFVPDRPQRELRELTRYRTQLVRERAAEVNRVQKTLEGANIKLANVATDLMGVSGRAILAQLVAGQTDAAALAQLARGKLRPKIPELERALAGRFGPHQSFLLARQVAHIDFLDAAIAELDAAIAERLSPFEAAVRRLETVPGVGRRTAEVLLAEIGTDMARFPSASHLASWAGMCPGNHESAGKRHSGAPRRGNAWLRAALIEAAKAACRTKRSYLGAQYRRLAPRRGKQKAAVAVGHSILVIAYHLLAEGTTYHDLGRDFFDQRDRQAVERRLVHRLEDLGYAVALTPIAAD